MAMHVSARGRSMVILLAACGLLVAPLAGCAANVGDAELSPLAADEPCRAMRLAGEDERSPALVSFVCEAARGPGRLLEELPCRAPEDAGLTAALSIDAGAVDVAVASEDKRVLFTDTYTNASARHVDVRLPADAAAGVWTAVVARDDGFAGGFTIGVFCGQPDEA